MKFKLIPAVVALASLAVPLHAQIIERVLVKVNGDRPPATVKLDLKKPVGSDRRPPAPRPDPVPPQKRPKKGSDPVAGGSWWAARAQAGEVTSGFSKDEIMRPATENPRAEDGVFVRVSGLLRQLSECL